MSSILELTLPEISFEANSMCGKLVILGSTCALTGLPPLARHSRGQAHSKPLPSESQMFCYVVMSYNCESSDKCESSATDCFLEQII